MNQTPMKPQTQTVTTPHTLPKKIEPPKWLVLLTIVTAILLAVSLIVLDVALLIGPTDMASPSTEKQPSQTKDPNKETEPPESTVPDTRPKVALTFDDGPHVERTKQIVNELNKYGYHATFFVVGNRVDGSEYSGADALRYAVANGNEIGIHGYTHNYYYDTCSDATYEHELSATKDAIAKVAPDAVVTLMRPVGGRISKERKQTCPYSVTMWHIDSEDWKYKGADDEETKAQNVDAIVENVMSSVSAGKIILMHDIYDNTLEATKIILQRLNEAGYNVVSVSELLADNANNANTENT